MADHKVRRFHAPELDGMRALAVWSVMLFHAGARLMEGGWIGVDVFFVLSGFLITTLLTQELERKGSISFGRFWIRRVLRLIPAYIVYLIPLTVFFLLSDEAYRSIHGGWTPLGYLALLWSYTSNLAPQGGIWEYQHLTRHLWFLAVEQQFYVLLPVLCFLALRLGLSIGVALVLILVVFNLGSHAGLFPGPEKLSLFARGSSLFIGCLAALWSGWLEAALTRGKDISVLRHVHLLSITIFLAAIGAVLYLAAFRAMPEFSTVTPLSLLLYISMGLAIAGYWRGWSRLASPVLGHAVLTYAGKISYGVYIYHMIVWSVVFLYLDTSLDLFESRYLTYGLMLMIYFWGFPCTGLGELPLHRNAFPENETTVCLNDDA